MSVFTSTRNKKLKIGFWQSVVQGIAPDGGLLVPTAIPKLSSKFISNKKFWKKSSISDISCLLHRLFIPKNEISDQALRKMMAKAHTFDLPLEALDDSTFILRIDTGPTGSFKDIAARSLATLLEEYCQRFKRVLNIIVATSGDTGVAIADAFGGSEKVTVSILYPSGGVSEIQEKQMIQVGNQYGNVQAISVLGNFDTCQDISKILQEARELKAGNEKSLKILTDGVRNKLGKKLEVREAAQIISLVSKLNLSSANSINIWRLIPQMTQYFVAYGKLVRLGKISPGEAINFSVPTGNVGHLMAGLYASLAGLPVKRFIIGTNANNILANVIGSGTIKHHIFSKTSSPSMDILDPSNLERLIFLAAEQTKKSATIDFIRMKQDIKNHFANDSIISLENYGVTKDMLKYLQNIIWAEDVETDEEIFAMMERVSRKNKLVMEPHGITALIATIRARSKRAVEANDVVVIMETAHPDKFPSSLEEARIKVPNAKKHLVLSKLAKTNLNKMKRGKTIPVNLLRIAKKIKAIAF